MTVRLVSRGVTISAYHGSGVSDKPSAANTGYAPGTVFTTWTGGATITNSSTVLQDIHFTNAHTFYTVTGTNLTIRNCKFDVGIVFDKSDGLLFEDSHVVTNGINFSSVLGATMRRCNVEAGRADIFHITGDQPGRSQCTNIVIEDCFFHGPKPILEDHSDGLQVRGVDGFTMTHTVIDMGPWIANSDDPLNAALFFENGNGGNENVTVDGCWFNGGAKCVRYFGVTGTFSITDCKIGPDFFYSVCEGNVVPTQSGNITEADGLPTVFVDTE